MPENERTNTTSGDGLSPSERQGIEYMKTKYWLLGLYFTLNPPIPESQAEEYLKNLTPDEMKLFKELEESDGREGALREFRSYRHEFPQTDFLGPDSHEAYLKRQRLGLELSDEQVKTLEESYRQRNPLPNPRYSPPDPSPTPSE